MRLLIEAVDDDPAVALAEDGRVFARDAWHTGQNHSVELLPRIEALLRREARTKAGLTAVFVDIGPGGYAALRVGVSIAKTVAHALAIPAVGAGRLELDAWRAPRDPAALRVLAVHRAGRGDLAWAAYAHRGDAWRELEAPRIEGTADFIAGVRPGDALVGDVDDALRAAAVDAGAVVLEPWQPRIDALAALGEYRLAARRTVDPRALVPLYLRAPAIGPQRPL